MPMHPQPGERKSMGPKRCTLLYAQDFLGIEEQGGPNRGPAVELFLRAADLRRGAPWCAAFVNACAEYGFALRNLRSPLEKVGRQGFVQDYVTYGKGQGWEVGWDEVEPGDLFALWFPSKDRYAHIGLVYDPPRAGVPDGEFTTIEGNTGDQGEREGYKVATRKRPLSDGVIFLRWTE